MAVDQVTRVRVSADSQGRCDRLPRTDAGEWWEIDDADTGVPYYYHTVRGETSWQRPEGEFVIPLSMIQVPSFYFPAPHPSC